MIPTPDTSHVDYDRVYEPAEDSFLFLDTLSSPSETKFLQHCFPPTTHGGRRDGCHGGPPLVVEIGPGSGVVLAFVHANATTLFGHPAILTAAIDANGHACRATRETVRQACVAAAAAAGDSDNNNNTASIFGTTPMAVAQGDLTSPLSPSSVDVLIFNPPYVPTPELPVLDPQQLQTTPASQKPSSSSFETDSYLLSLSYAGGPRNGMETTDRLVADLPRVLSPRGCAYVLLCRQNLPDEFKARVRDGTAFTRGDDEAPEKGEEDTRSWHAETVGSSGKTAGWEKLQIIRIWRE